ncbi:hypothetical protein OY671_012786, partial [Metschnikowia pulcherrima]
RISATPQIVSFGATGTLKAGYAETVEKLVEALHAVVVGTPVAEFGHLLARESHDHARRAIAQTAFNDDVVDLRNELSLQESRFIIRK